MSFWDQVVEGLLTSIRSGYIFSALILGLVTALGWVVNNALARKEQRRIQNERRDDMQKAIYAEISAFVVLQEQNNLAQHRRRLVNDIETQNITPFVILEEHDRVYRALLTDIHFLPKETIDEVTTFYHTLAQISQMQEAMVRPEFAGLDKERRAKIYGDYISTIETALYQGKESLEYIRLYSEGGREAVVETKSALSAQSHTDTKKDIRAWIDSENQ